MLPPADDTVIYLGCTDHRGKNVRFGVRLRDLRHGLFCIGKTGVGKSHFTANCAVQNAESGIGFALFDPHGSLAQHVLSSIPEKRQDDLIYLNVPDANMSWTFNPLAGVQEKDEPLAVAAMIDVFKKLWPDEWGPRTEHVLRNVLFTLLETSGSDLADIPRLLTDKEFREEIVDGVSNPAVRDFWKGEYERYSFPFRSMVISPLLNKIGALLTDPTLRRILTGHENTLNLREIMDSGKMLIVNLDKGQIGEGPASLLGSFLVAHIGLTALSRSDIHENDRRDFILYLDEFSTFTTLALAGMFAELRKYRSPIFATAQHLSQLQPAIRDAIFGNVGTLVAFRIGAQDASYLAKEFAPTFSAQDLISLPRFGFYTRLMIDGEMSVPFSATTLASPSQ